MSSQSESLRGWWLLPSLTGVAAAAGLICGGLVGYTLGINQDRQNEPLQKAPEKDWPRLRGDSGSLQEKMHTVAPSRVDAG